MDRERLSVLQDELQFVRTVVRRFAQDRVLVAAASLSYTSLLAIVPLFAIAFSVMVKDIIAAAKTPEAPRVVSERS
tara:strand:+ start:652 stop:879 length:228 start_codon:yes stop_codon:yes gene_type:complete